MLVLWAIQEDYLLHFDFFTVILVILFRLAIDRGSGSTKIPSILSLLMSHTMTSTGLETLFNSWHFVNHPEHLWQIPALAMYGHLHMSVQLDAYMTIHKVCFFLKFFDW